MKTVLFFSLLALALQSAPIVLEAEDGILSDVTVYTAQTGYSGTGYVGNFSVDGSSVSVTATVPTEGSYNLKIIYYDNDNYKEQDILVNGSASGKLIMEASPTFDTANIGGVWLNAGDNTISVVKNWGWGWVDAFILESRPPNVYNPTTTLIDPLATVKTRALYDTLLSYYGTHIISGIHDTRVNRTGDYAHLNQLESITGVKPRLMSFDFSDYSTLNPYLWENGGHVLGYVGNLSRETEGILDWHQQSGGCAMVEITWHWHAPIAEQAGINNFMATNVNFDVREAVKAGTPENTAILEDIDSISMQMKRLADADVPVLWRPLHEAGGGWFWWGAHGPDAAKALWDIIYDRMVNHHNLHNMIWVWSTPEVDWYPGNDKVDIVGFDSYPGAYEYGTQKSMFDHMYDLCGGEKIVAMTENGPIPHIDSLFIQDAPWAWWSTWASWTTDENEGSHLIDVYSNTKTIIYDDCITPIYASSKLLKNESVKLMHFGSRLEIQGADNSDWKLFNASGRVVKSGYGTIVDLKGLSRGAYLISVKDLLRSTIQVK